METVTTDSEKAEITVKLSYMDIKYLLLKYRDFHIDSTEMKICKHLAAGLKAYLVRKAKQGGLPQHIIDDAIMNLENSKPKEFVDKSTILINPEKENENE